MSSQTSLVASNVRLRQWADQIRECQARPQGMKVETWCEQNGITKANYYYRLKQVRKACLQATANNVQEFVDLSALLSAKTDTCASVPAAVLRTPAGLTLEISDTASTAFLRSLIGAMNHAE